MHCKIFAVQVSGTWRLAADLISQLFCLRKVRNFHLKRAKSFGLFNMCYFWFRAVFGETGLFLLLVMPAIFFFLFGHLFRIPH